MRAASQASRPDRIPETRPKRFDEGDREHRHAATAALQRRLTAFARRFVGDRDEAEDVAQEALFRAARGWGRLRSAERAEAWVFRICRHAAIDHVRARRVRQGVWAPLPADAHDWAGESRSVRSSAGAVPGRSVGVATRGAARHLPAHHRLLLTLHYGCGYSQPLLCRMTGLSASALRVRLFRARGLLALQLRRESHPARARFGAGGIPAAVKGGRGPCR